MSAAVLTARDVNFAYRRGRDILAGVNLELAAGEAAFIWGRNGAGKTTLGLVLAGLLKPQAGEVATTPRGARAAMVLADPAAAILGATPAEDVRLGPALLRVPPGEVDRRTAAALAVAGLTPRRDTPCAELSLGEQKRVALAAAFALDPVALILDEPFAFLDDEQAAALRRVIAEERARGTAFLILSGQRAAGDGCGRTLLLEEGRLRPSPSAVSP